MFFICLGVIFIELNNSLRSNSLGMLDKQFRDCFRCIFSIAIKVVACALHQANKHEKSGRAFAYPQARESKPYTHKQEIPPAYHGEHLSVSLCIMQFLDFSLAQKSAKRFFFQYVKTRSVYDRTNITIYWLKGFIIHGLYTKFFKNCVICRSKEAFAVSKFCFSFL